MPSRYLPFVDWMKAAGITLIVYGHVAAATSVGLTPPVYPKQLGVAFFVFVAAFTLAREQRHPARVVFNRYFEVFSFGVVFALAMSAVGLWLWQDPNQSNYLPFAFGLNVLMNDFPANPTTWYIGTYLHVLLCWVLLRRISVRLWMVAAVCLVEVLIRTILLQAQVPFIAYMLLSNWLAVFFLGSLLGQSSGERPPTRMAVAGVVLMIAWPLLSGLIGWERRFPFMTVPDASALGSALAVSCAATVIYLGYTLAAYTITSQLRASTVAQFIARNTVVIFIAHMPVYYALEYFFLPTMSSYGLRASLEFVICLPLLAAVSEVLRRRLGVEVWRARLADHLARLASREPARSHA